MDAKFIKQNINWKSISEPILGAVEYLLAKFPENRDVVEIHKRYRHIKELERKVDYVDDLYKSDFLQIFRERNGAAFYGLKGFLEYEIGLDTYSPAGAKGYVDSERAREIYSDLMAFGFFKYQPKPGDELSLEPVMDQFFRNRPLFASADKIEMPAKYFRTIVDCNYASLSEDDFWAAKRKDEKAVESIYTGLDAKDCFDMIKFSFFDYDPVNQNARIEIITLGSDVKKHVEILFPKHKITVEEINGPSQAILNVKADFSAILKVIRPKDEDKVTIKRRPKPTL